MNYTFKPVSGSLQYHFKKTNFLILCLNVHREIGEPRKTGNMKRYISL
jgi:hypothetical protein